MPKKKKTVLDAADKIEKARADYLHLVRQARDGVLNARLALIAAEAGIDLPPHSPGVPFANYIDSIKDDLTARRHAMTTAIMLLDEVLAEQAMSEEAPTSSSTTYGFAVTKSNGTAEN